MNFYLCNCQYCYSRRFSASQNITGILFPQLRIRHHAICYNQDCHQCYDFSRVIFFDYEHNGNYYVGNL